MSIFFECEGAVVWNPGLISGQIYVAFARCVGDLVECDTGLDTTIPDDTVRIDSVAFHQFLVSILNLMSRTTNTLMRSQLGVVIGPAVRMLGDRLTEEDHTLYEREMADSLATAGMCATKLGKAPLPPVDV
jgi:hypothetical protein